MPRSPRSLVLILAACAFVFSGRVRGDESRALTYSEIVERLYHLEWLAVPPEPGEESGSSTSRDRAARYDPERDLYTDWYANADGGGSIRQEGDGVVAAELEGPGVIWRIWTADPKAGSIRFYIDGATTPALDLPFERLFDTKDGPFPFGELVRPLARGWNCFVPIPFQKSCKVVLGKDWGNYFQFTHTRFPSNWRVPSFRGAFNDEEKAALAEADRRWSRRGPPTPAKDGAVVEKSLTLAPGQSIDAFELDGPRAINGLICKVVGINAREAERALRELTISIAWDGEKTPSVWAPLGDFFGSAPGLNPFRSLPCGHLNEGMYASWYMPFASRAVICLTNDGPSAREVAIKVLHAPLTRPADRLLRFHAKWHRDHFGKDGIGRYAKDRWPDWPILLTSGGRGRFCGVNLHIWNPHHAWDKELSARYRPKVSEICPVPDWFQANVVKNDYWWGEGDEKFFVDVEKFPSTFGTGSEDYIGYAWGTPAVFDSATQCQARNSANIGHLSVARWQVADNVPFQDSFEASIEKYHGNNWPLLYAATAYWYQEAGSADSYPALPLKDRLDYYAMPEPAR